MATVLAESATSQDKLRLAKKDPEVARSASASDRFTVTFTLEGTRLLELQDLLAARLAGIGVERVSRMGMRMSLYGVVHGREGEVFHELQAAIDDVNRAREAEWEDMEHRRSATEAAAAVSETQLQAVRESFETARRLASAR